MPCACIVRREANYLFPEAGIAVGSGSGNSECDVWGLLLLLLLLCEYRGDREVLVKSLRLRLCLRECLGVGGVWFWFCCFWIVGGRGRGGDV